MEQLFAVSFLVSAILSVSLAAGPTIYNPDVTLVVAGFPGLTEGPIFDPLGNFYVVSPSFDLGGEPDGGVYKLDLAKKEKILLCEPKVGQDTGLPNGGASDRDGVIWIADKRLGLLRVTKDGKCTQELTKDYHNRTLQGLNDIAFDYTGTMWLTAPAGFIAPNPYLSGTNFSEPVNGSIYSYIPTQDKFVLLDTGFNFSNGIVVKHDDKGVPKKLFVTETFQRTIWVYDITGPGQIGEKKLWATAPGLPDGMDFDSEGNLLLADFDQSHIEVYGPEGGSMVARIKMPFSKVTNLEFQNNSKVVYVTEGSNNSVWKFEWINKGMPHYSQLNLNVVEDKSPNLAECGHLPSLMALICAGLLVMWTTSV